MFMYVHDPLVDLPRPSAEDPPLEFLRSGAENPPSDLSRPGAEQIFLLYIEEKFSALGRGESTFGSIAPGRGTDFSSLYRRNRTFKPNIGPVLGQYKRPDWASVNAITTGPLQARFQLGQYKRLLELAHKKWLDLAQVQQMRRAFFSTN